MAVHSRHPAWPVPSAPERERTGHLLLRAWCAFVLFLAVSAVAWIHAVGPVAATVVAVGAAVVSGIVWATRRPPFDGRRLPWFVLAYVLWAALSLLWTPAAVSGWLLLAVTTLQGLFVAAVLTWRELVGALATAVQWALGLSLVFELIVSLFVGGPLLPGFRLPTGAHEPADYWSQDDLLRGGPIQGVFGDANLLAAVALLGIVLFAILMAAKPGRRVAPGLWIAVAVFLLLRAASSTAYIAAGAVALVLGTVLLMRTVRRAGGRTRYYVLFAAVGVAGALAIWLARDAVFDGWVVSQGETVAQARNVWAEAFARLGVVGLVLMAGIAVSFVWRAWFFAIDRPRFDLDAERPYSSLTLLPTLTATILLVTGLTDSGPPLLWGWMLVVALGTKITQAPLVGVGPAEQSAAIERGDRVRP
ncbi:O-antigen ligase family protein [Microbacterium sp. SORGH_AS_0888]|uniref:O-antigen ligase family protein n=1 Tax=Microbacterium sp. SORGH_AS_0888 TaxID=3041791 RepID=UPI002787B360|nr:O-antigen ligase family protein [Microbacterium sp. SORGH_AS_0888]MDQ1127903.1 exopolysaccharide production protein ExoQ [Microbacterium sp. SORGH_AS_0888]